MRINKYVAQALGVSRREADDLIEAGRISVGSSTAKLGMQVEVDSVIRYDKEIIQPSQMVYLKFHKPVGYVCSRKDQGDNQTIYKLLPKKYHHLKTAGRLDKDSSGLILLSNDGDFNQALTHPKYSKQKVYEARLDRKLDDQDLQKINRGLRLNDGLSKLSVKPLPSGYSITMSEGRNRQIRRTFGALGYTVTRLHRTQFGDYSLDNLETGKFIEVAPPAQPLLG